MNVVYYDILAIQVNNYVDQAQKMLYVANIADIIEKGAHGDRQWIHKPNKI